MANPISRLISWIKRDKDTAESAKVIIDPAKAMKLTKAQEYAKRHPRKYVFTHPLRGRLSFHDIRCLHLGGMGIASIRRHYGIRAAKYVASKA